MAAQVVAERVETTPTPHSNSERITAIQAILSQLATKADLERQTRLLIIWYVGAQIALLAALIHFLGGG